MSWFKNMRIFAQLILVFLTVIMLAAALGGFSIYKLSVVNDTSHQIKEKWMPGIVHVSHMHENTADLRIKELQLVDASEKAKKDKYLHEMEGILKTFEENRQSYEKLISTDEEKKLYGEFTTLWKEYQAEHKQLLDLSAQNKKEAAAALLQGKSQEEYNDMSAKLGALVKLNVAGGDAASDMGDVVYASARFRIIAGVVVVCVLGMMFALWLGRNISRPLVKAAEVADKMARGVLSEELAVSTQDETGRLSASINGMTRYLKELAAVSNRIAAGDLTAQVEPKCAEDQFGNSYKRMIENLHDSVSQISAGSNQVAAASSQIAAASDQSKQASQTLASSSEEITATIHEMAASVRQVAANTQTQSAAATETSASVTQMVAGLQAIAENTRRLASLTGTADEAARKGQRTLEGADQSMRRIGSSVESAGQTINQLGERAENIGRIVETIDDIADQTNLLALNAAIEAARAGEHGLGFAVVADEVRKLAERSARSTKEIGELIESIQREARVAVSQMEESNQTVREYMADRSVKEALGSIISSVEEIVASTREIEAATAEQSAGAEQIAKATQDLSRLTQEISAATEEQSVGTAEVVRAMEQLRGVVHQSVEMAGELQSSAEILYRQSDVLNGVVGRFDTGEGRTAASYSDADRRGAGAAAAAVGPPMVRRIREADLVN